MKKYKLSKAYTREFEGITLHRVEALYSFNDVVKGDLGGWVESENNLSQSGDCWVYNNGMVMEDARVYDDAIVMGNAHIYENGNVCDNAVVADSVIVCDSATVANYAKVSGMAKITGNSFILDHAKVRSRAIIADNAKVTEFGLVMGNALLSGSSKVTGHGIVMGSAKISGNTVIGSKAVIDNKVIVSSSDNVMTIPVAIDNKQVLLTFYRSDIDNEIYITSNYYTNYGTIDEFKYKIFRTYDSSDSTYRSCISAIDIAEASLRVKKR